MLQKTMNAKDAVSGSLASCTVKLSDGKRYNLMQLYKFEAKYEVGSATVAILGKPSKGNKPTGGKGTWSGIAYYNTSVFRLMMLDYKKTGVLPSFDATVTNEDPTSAAGRQITIVKGCLINSLIIAKYDASSENPLEEEINGTFDDWDIETPFNLLDGMRVGR